MGLSYYAYIKLLQPEQSPRLAVESPTIPNKGKPSPPVLQTDSKPTQAESLIFQNLDNLLKARNWEEASGETFAVMLKLAGREHQGWLDSKSLNNFSCPRLKEIDQLWVKYSDGLFGFSVQKHIYLATGNKLGWLSETDSKEWNNFANNVGWTKGGFESNFSLAQDIPKGHFPFFRRSKTSQVVKNIDQILFWHCDL